MSALVQRADIIVVVLRFYNYFVTFLGLEASRNRLGHALLAVTVRSAEDGLDANLCIIVAEVV